MKIASELGPRSVLFLGELLVELDSSLGWNDGTASLLLDLEKRLLVLRLRLRLIAVLLAYLIRFDFGLLLTDLIRFLVGLTIIFHAFVVSKLVAEIERDAVELDVALVDGLDQLLQLLFLDFRLLLTICNQEHSLFVFLGASEVDQQVKADDESINHVTVLWTL